MKIKYKQVKKDSKYLAVKEISTNLPSKFLHYESRKNNQIINPFGGINFVVETIKQSGAMDVIDNQLGIRPKQATYSFSDLILCLWSVFFCGGDCAEDINEHLKSYLKSVPRMKVADADTILWVLKNLKTNKEEVKGPTDAVYQTNRNDKFNELNISLLNHIGLLKDGGYYNFDFDNEVLKTEKYDTTKTYKMAMAISLEWPQ